MDAKKMVVHIRVEADYEVVEAVATQIAELMREAGYELIEQSVARPHRWEPASGQVYLTVRE